MWNNTDMPDTPSITTIKSFMYRGKQEEWSNTYHFNGTQPANAAAWKTLADALIAQEKTVINPNHSFVRAYGYNAGTAHSVAQIDYVALGGTLVTGTLPISGFFPMSGDQCAKLRAQVGVNSRGRKVYLQKYYHGGAIQTTSPDLISAGQKTALDALGATLIGGTLPGSFAWCGPQGATASLPSGSAFSTVHTLKRRGKRP